MTWISAYIWIPNCEDVYSRRPANNFRTLFHMTTRISLLPTHHYQESSDFTIANTYPFSVHIFWIPYCERVRTRWNTLITKDHTFSFSPNIIFAYVCFVGGSGNDPSPTVRRLIRRSTSICISLHIQLYFSLQRFCNSLHINLYFSSQHFCISFHIHLYFSLQCNTSWVTQNQFSE